MLVFSSVCRFLFDYAHDYAHDCDHDYAYAKGKILSFP